MKLAWALPLAMLALPAGAQQLRAQALPRQDALPDSIAEQVVDLYNRDGTIRLNGASEIAAGTRVEAGIAVLNGPLRIEGVVVGDVVVINGDAQLGDSARVEGDVIAVGGTATVAASAVVAGRVLSYREPLRFRYEDGRLRYVPPHLERGLSAGRDWRFGRADVLLASHESYNRAEGLPIMFGPRVRLGNGNPTHLQAFAIYRTSSGLSLDRDELGYLLTAEQQLGVRGLRLSAALFSEITPIERWQVTNRESSLATFLLHRDYRDHYERTGWSAGLRMQRPDRAWGGELRYRDEDHEAVPARSIFSVLDHGDPWRQEPVVAEGRLRSVSAALHYDTRNDPVDPSFGWLLQLHLEQGVGGSLALPAATPGQAGARSDFTELQLDARRYLRLSPYAQLAIRALVAGSLDGEPLPPQRQHALGGEGSLPAFNLFQFDCGARNQATAGEAAFPFYGCDRISLLQLEYQAGFPLFRRLAEEIGIDTRFTNAFRWVAFFNAGRAWTEPEARDGRGGGLSDLAADAGAGLRIGRLGAYWAIPLSSSEKRLNFFVRLGPTL